MQENFHRKKHLTSFQMIILGFAVFASLYIDFYLQFFMTDHLGPIYHTMTALLL